MSKYKIKDTPLICDHDCGDATLMPTEYVGKPTPIMFEGREFMGVENPDAYLSTIYGDYMKLPPVEKRLRHFSMHLDLNKPYKEYKRKG